MPVRPETVSYTHLSTLEIFVKDDVVSVRPIHIRDEQLKSRMRTVSYTHLDVYKRQVEIMEKRVMGKLKEEEIMCKVISVVNQKGGVGKTLSLIHIYKRKRITSCNNICFFINYIRNKLIH